jgi:hypothetical protein
MTAITRLTTAVKFLMYPFIDRHRSGVPAEALCSSRMRAG